MLFYSKLNNTVKILLSTLFSLGYLWLMSCCSSVVPFFALLTIAFRGALKKYFDEPVQKKKV